MRRENANGLVIFYADKITDSMQRTIDETERRRVIQMAYNEKEGITPETVFKSKEEIMQQRSILIFAVVDQQRQSITAMIRLQNLKWPIWIVIR